MAQQRRDEGEDLARKGGEHAAQTPGAASNFAHFLGGMDFPATKQDLLRHVQQKGAPPEVQKIVDQMPERQYFNMADAMKGFGEVR